MASVPTTAQQTRKKVCAYMYFKISTQWVHKCMCLLMGQQKTTHLNLKLHVLNYQTALVSWDHNRRLFANVSQESQLDTSKPPH